MISLIRDEVLEVDCIVVRTLDGAVVPRTARGTALQLARTSERRRNRVKHQVNRSPSDSCYIKLHTKQSEHHVNCVRRLTF